MKSLKSEIQLKTKPKTKICRYLSEIVTKGNEFKVDKSHKQTNKQTTNKTKQRGFVSCVKYCLDTKIKRYRLQSNISTILYLINTFFYQNHGVSHQLYKEIYHSYITNHYTVVKNYLKIHSIRI